MPNPHFSSFFSMTVCLSRRVRNKCMTFSHRLMSLCGDLVQILINNFRIGFVCWFPIFYFYKILVSTIKILYLLSGATNEYLKRDWSFSWKAHALNKIQYLLNKWGFSVNTNNYWKKDRWIENSRTQGDSDEQNII